jgi:hypothetical protein
VAVTAVIELLTHGDGFSFVTPAMAGLAAAVVGFLLVYLTRLRRPTLQTTTARM